MTFDLAKNNFAEMAEVGYEFELKLPVTDEGTGAFIKVRGDDSKTVKSFGRRKLAEYQARAAAAKKRGKEPDDLTYEEAEDVAIEAAIIRIIDWRGINDGGEKVVFTKESADKILREHSWIREQIMEESAQVLNFRSR